MATLHAHEVGNSPSECPAAEDIKGGSGQTFVHGQWGLNIKFRISMIADRATQTLKSGIFTKLQIAALGPGKKVPLLCGRLRTPRRCSDTKGALFYQPDGSRMLLEVENT